MTAHLIGIRRHSTGWGTGTRHPLASPGGATHVVLTRAGLSGARATSDDGGFDSAVEDES